MRRSVMQPLHISRGIGPSVAHEGRRFRGALGGAAACSFASCANIRSRNSRTFFSAQARSSAVIRIILSVRRLRAASVSKPRANGCLREFGARGWAQPEGVFVFRFQHVLTLASRQLWTQLCRGSKFPIATSQEAPLDQLEFPLLARLDAPSIAHPYYVKRCKTFREAVRMAWTMRRVHRMTYRQLAAEAGIRPQFISDYLHTDDRPYRRDLPADLIAAFEATVGNCLISQWVAAQSRLTVLEEMTAARAA